MPENEKTFTHKFKSNPPFLEAQALQLITSKSLLPQDLPVLGFRESSVTYHLDVTMYQMAHRRFLLVIKSTIHAWSLANA